MAGRTVALCAFALATAPAASAQVADPDPARFAETIARFAAWDRQNSFPERAVLFVGSSSIAGWPTAERFPGLPVINRGIGGSQISDFNHFIEPTVLETSDPGSRLMREELLDPQSTEDDVGLAA